MEAAVLPLGNLDEFILTNLGLQSVQVIASD